MTTYIALFRGVNVGGHNKLPMKELAASIERIIGVPMTGRNWRTVTKLCELANG